MKKIYKYAIDIDNTFIKMPSGSTILHADCLNADYCIWAEVDPSKETVIRHIKTIGTGSNIPPSSVFIATFLHPPFVWHVYDRGETK